MIPGWGPYAFPVIALLGLYHTRETDPGTLARDRAAAGAIAATFYLSYAVSFAALWGPPWVLIAPFFEANGCV
jgi:hypothetical protein